jgi:hypothetical protein
MTQREAKQDVPDASEVSLHEYNKISLPVL